jgi:carboxymethylenebutenolidase
MRKFILLLLLLVACQPVVETHDEHVGCPPEQVSAGTCELADEGERNVDIFDDLNPDLIQTESVSYAEGASGYLAQPKAEGVYPAVIMIHEFWGLNDNIKYMAGLLAQEGYVVLAVDLYGEVAETSERARELAGAARENQEKATANMKKAAEYLRSLPSVNPDKLASMGWCFGGGQSLQLALSGEKLAATVIYYGSLVTETDKLSVISWPVLGIFGAEDTGIPVSSVEEFKKSLNELGVGNEIHIYPGVGHAFANPSGARYAAEETKDAWDKTVAFLRKNLR